MPNASKTRPTAPRYGRPHSGKQGSLQDRAAALRAEADRLLARASRKAKTSSVDGDSNCLSSPAASSHDNSRKFSDALGSTSAARRKPLRSGDAMGFHAKIDTDSSIDVGQNLSLSADKPKHADTAVRGTRVASLKLQEMSIGELSALLSVYEQAARAFTRNVFWPELGPHGFCRVDDEAERCASIQRAILDEFGSRSSASDADQADITDPAEASNGRRHQ